MCDILLLLVVVDLNARIMYAARRRTATPKRDGCECNARWCVYVLCDCFAFFWDWKGDDSLQCRASIVAVSFLAVVVWNCV